MAAACGAAAEVPANGANPGVWVRTLSAAATSGLRIRLPPVARKSPGVIGAPLGS